MIGNLDERSKNDFLTYANSVIKSRAIPSAEDNLKPIHRKILYTLWEDKVTPEKPTKKCATEAGRVLAYSPHGDASVYGAMVRMAQWWKLRYPLIEMQGNCGNILGDGPAAARYTECRLSPIGMMMLEDLNKNCVDFKPNYDETTEEPVTLPSKFPYLLCGNNSGIAVGMSSDLVSHNFHEVADAIEFYMENKNCTTMELMNFIKGPDFPTGGVIVNGEDLLKAYQTGHGAVKLRPHYDIVKQSVKTLIIFHDLPYGVEFDSGVKEPLKKLILDDGYDVFENIEFKYKTPRSFDIVVTLGRNARVQECLNLLFTKTRLANTIKINQTIIVNGEPKVLSLKDLIEHWVNYRSYIIQRIAQNDYAKTNHKLTVTLGFQKCLSDIDLLVSLIRNADSRADAKVKIIKAFELTDEQAEAVLDMKLSKLSRLDLEELNEDEANLKEQVAKLKHTIENESDRYDIIRRDLNEIRQVLKDDKRLTEIIYNKPVEGVELDKPLVKKEWLVYDDGVVCTDEQIAMDNTKAIQNNLQDVVFAYGRDTIFGYTNKEICPLDKQLDPLIGAFVADESKDKIVSVTAKGNVKVSKYSEYKQTKNEKAMKLKDDDVLVYVNVCNDNDFLILYDGEDHLLKLAIKDLPVASKLTVGVKSGFSKIVNASIVSDSDVLLCCTKDNKGKFTSVKDFSVDSRGNKGQLLAEGTSMVKVFLDSRSDIYIIPKQGKPIIMNRSKLSIKSRTAIGASLSTRILTKIV